MGLFVKRSFNNPENRTYELSDPKIVSLFGGTTPLDLPSMNPRKAVGLPAVYTCVDIKSSDIAMLPRHLYRRTRDGKERVTEDDQLYLVKSSPNDHMNAFDFWRLLLMDKYLWGNGYALKNINQHGRPTSYSLLKPYEVDVYQDPKTGQVVYTDLITTEIYPPDRIIHLKGFSFDGIKGVSVITLARLAFQKGLAIEEFAAHFYHNKTNLSGWIEIDDWIEDDEQVEKLRTSWEKKYRGNGKADTAVLMGGSKYHQATMSMTDSQFVENQKFSLQQLGMLFRIPPDRLGYLDDANRSNMEGTALQYATFSMQSEIVQLEQELNRKLIRPSQQTTHYWKIELKAILRGDTKAQGEYIKIMMNSGIMTINEIRELQELNSIGPEGDRILLPMNMLPADRMDDYIDSIVSKAVKKYIDPKTKTHGQDDPSELSELFSSNGHQS